MPTWAEIRQCAGAMLRSSGIGFFLGLLPGCAPAVTTFIAYDVEKRFSKTPERFGKGAIEGVAAPEGANNATSSGGFVPFFAFGLPTGPALAVLLGGLMLYGLQPGPMLFQTNPKFVWAVIASMYVGNVILLVLNLPLVGFWTRIALIPFPVLGPLIILCSVIGAYSIRFMLFDVWVALLFGGVGYLMRKLHFPVAPLVLWGYGSRSAPTHPKSPSTTRTSDPPFPAPWRKSAAPRSNPSGAFTLRPDHIPSASPENTVPKLRFSHQRIGSYTVCPKEMILKRTAL
jgi:TctA family transporter